MAMLNFPGMTSDTSRNETKMSNDTLRLMLQFLKSPKSVGTLIPSSRELAQAMLAPIDFNNLSAIVEFGPGTGPLTAQIAARLPDRARYIGVELNKEFYERLSGKFPRLQFVNRDAADIEDILKSSGIEGVDAIMCNLPWASLPSEMQPKILNAAHKCLRVGGVFVTYAYLQGLILPGAWTLRRRLRNRFSKVETTRIVWNNVPPAFAYICHR